MICFDVTLKGFDGNTDVTDHLVKWVFAPSRRRLAQWLTEMDLWPHLHATPHEMDHDFSLEDEGFWLTGVDVILHEDGKVEWNKGQSIDQWKAEASAALA